MYLQSQKDCLRVEDVSRNFFRNVKAFQAKEKPKAFNPMSLFPGKTEREVAYELAAFFNRISSEFQPLKPADIPRTHDRQLPVLAPSNGGTHQGVQEAKIDGNGGYLFSRLSFTNMRHYWQSH